MKLSGTIIGVGIGAMLGGVAGYVNMLCMTGTCPLTGSWQGGAMIGGVFGLALLGGNSPIIPLPWSRQPEAESSQARADDADVVEHEAGERDVD